MNNQKPDRAAASAGPQTSSSFLPKKPPFLSLSPRPIVQREASKRLRLPAKRATHPIGCLSQPRLRAQALPKLLRPVRRENDRPLGKPQHHRPLPTRHKSPNPTPPSPFTAPPLASTAAPWCHPLFQIVSLFSQTGPSPSAPLSPVQPKIPLHITLKAPAPSRQHFLPRPQPSGASPLAPFAFLA
ncbi:hypothetical protein BH09VER1_BH09VER1_10100 [soil metagenome]